MASILGASHSKNATATTRFFSNCGLKIWQLSSFVVKLVFSIKTAIQIILSILSILRFNFFQSHVESTTDISS